MKSPESSYFQTSPWKVDVAAAVIKVLYLFKQRTLSSSEVSCFTFTLDGRISSYQSWRSPSTRRLHPRRETSHTYSLKKRCNSLLASWRTNTKHQGWLITTAAARQSGFHILNPRSVMSNYIKSCIVCPCLRALAPKKWQNFPAIASSEPPHLIKLV